MTQDHDPATDQEEEARRGPKTAEELAKIRAETDKIQHEDDRARRKAELEEAKLGLEIRKIEHELVEAEIRSVKAKRDYAELLTADKYHHVYRFTSDVNGASTKNCMEQLSQWCRLAEGAGRRADIEIVFSSPGGSVLDGLVLFDFILSLRRGGHSIDTNTLGYAASMAGILLQAGGKRRMAKEAWILIHEISFGAGGKIGEVEDTVEWIKRIQDRVLDIFAERCRQAAAAGTASKPFSKAQLKKHWLRKDWWISSDEALKGGLVDEVM